MENAELKLAEAFVEETDRHLFLTGKAGTGKTTFLRRIRKSSPKRMVVTAPTGVAAINARGVTLHSFFQLPFGPWIEGRELSGDAAVSHRTYRFSRTKRRLIESLDLLVIDEISMVRADVLDAVDSLLRRLRRSQQPFGGVQLLMIGDLGQLAPIAKDEEWQILRQVYDSPFFFSSRALCGTEWLTIELQHIYRQSDQRFIELLNGIRDGRLDDRSRRLLESRHRPGFRPPQDEGWITLSTHNRRVDAHNRERLERLPAKARSLRAEIEGDFPPANCQAPEELVLKLGAQVVFLRNDTARPQRYFNGKIGAVAGIAADEVRVRCPGDEDEIAVERATWQNVTYRLDDESGEIREEVKGSFTQFPLRLAWAMTIHKSQGLTFERAVIDAGQAFAPGQVYVALSRCKTLDGMVLLSPISPRSTQPDPSVQRFLAGEGSQSARPDSDLLAEARREYRWRILREAFDYRQIKKRTGSLRDLIRSCGPLLRVSGVADLAGSVNAAEQSVFSISEAFLRQLARFASQGLDPVEDPLVQERVEKATEYFGHKMAADVVPLTKIELATDNQEIETRVRRALEALRVTVATARAGVDACASGYAPAKVVRARTKASGTPPSPRSRKARRVPVPVPEDAPHRELVQQILHWRAEKARSLGDVAPNTVIHQRLAFQIASELPVSQQALKRIFGVGKKTLQNYGQDLLGLVAAYRREQGLSGAPRSRGQS